MAREEEPWRLDFPDFQCAPGLRLEAHRRISKLQHETLRERLVRIEQVLERLERRVWLAVYGVAAAVLAEAILPILSSAH